MVRNGTVYTCFKASLHDDKHLGIIYNKFGDPVGFRTWTGK